MKLVHEGKKAIQVSYLQIQLFKKFYLVESVHEGKKPYRCSICDYNFSQKNNLKAHVESVHENVKPYNCVICNYSCLKKGDMERYVESVDEEKKRKSQVHYLQLQLFKKG